MSTPAVSTATPAGPLLPSTPSQTAGPYLSIGLHWPGGDECVAAGHPKAVVVSGTVTDGQGEPVTDAVVETWQADPDGRFDHPDDPRGAVRHPHLRPFGRSETDDAGRWRVRTLKPGPVPAGDGTAQAPHIDVTVLGRGMMSREVTRIYFDDEQAANAVDDVLQAVAPERRPTLVARTTEGGYHFDIRLQGVDETVFFAL
ncbi:MAG TPA: protocatechuate 3,4-dioxygenase subunit alpha [Actinomycetales bacterium]